MTPPTAGKRSKETKGLMRSWTPDPIVRANLALSATAVLASFALAPPRFGASLAAGALLEMVNFRGLRRAAGKLFSGELDGGRSWMIQANLRLGFLAVAMYFVLELGANPFGLVLGLSLIVPATIWVAWRTAPAPQPPEAFDVPLPDDPSWDEWNPWLARERKPREDDAVTGEKEARS